MRHREHVPQMFRVPGEHGEYFQPVAGGIAFGLLVKSQGDRAASASIRQFHVEECRTGLIGLSEGEPEIAQTGGADHQSTIRLLHLEVFRVRAGLKLLRHVVRETQIKTGCSVRTSSGQLPGPQEQRIVELRSQEGSYGRINQHPHNREQNTQG